MPTLTGAVRSFVETGPILEVVDYSGGFTSGAGEFTPVLKRVAFSVPRAAFTAIVGETGSGKTLMALSILGIAPRSFRRTAGSVRFQGADLVPDDDKAMRRVRGAQISMVFQDARASLNPVFTVGYVGRKEAWQMAENMLERVRVPEPGRRMRQYPHEFSGGMAQRAQLAMALICHPSLLVLDEPTTGLDVTIQADILDLVVDLTASEGLSTLLITHDLGIVAETCDFVVVMKEGEVRETGTCEQVMTAPASPYTQQLLADSRLAGVPR
jgi:ABC-type dipeptide/oligopeptide/nickel transport system ATPase component